MTVEDTLVSVRYVVDDVAAAMDFYTTRLGFTLRSNPAPAFADVTRGRLRLLLSGPASSGARATPEDQAGPGRNRIQLVVDDLDAEIQRLRAADVPFRSEPTAGPGGRQILVADPAGNLVELFQPADSTGRAAGGTYVYGRERLGEWWGYVAGWGFVVGKTASCAAMALTFAAYVAPPAWQRCYLTANLSAYSQDAAHRRFARPVQVVGAAGCAVLVVTLRVASVLAGLGVFALGVGYRLWRHRRQS
jgi:catechol 2,3-dioxygenase-like lactoylglutathione lyase family enzyme